MKTASTKHDRPTVEAQASGKSSITFSEFAARWQKEVLVHWNPSTAKTVACLINAHFVPAFGTLPMTDIDSHLVQSFASKLAGTLSAGTVKRVWATLQAMWRSAILWGYALGELSVMIRPQIQHDQMRYCSVDEIRQILANAPGEDRGYFWLSVETGIRTAEQTALAASDVDLVNRTVQVLPEYAKTAGGRRIICMSSLLTAQVSEHLAGRKDGYLFQTPTGKPWNADIVRLRKLNPILERVDIPILDEKLLAKIVSKGRTVAQATPGEKCRASLGLHSFRHTNRWAMYSLQIPLEVQRKRLGLVSKDTWLGRHMHMLAPYERDAAEKLGELFGKDWPEPEPRN
jgi:integrase